MRFFRLIPLLLVALGCTAVVQRANAQGGSGQFVEEAAQKRRALEAADLDGDGKVSDYEAETFLRWQAMNPGVKLTKKERKALAKRAEEERKAEIKKYDLNGDGKLDDYENKLRIADQEKKRKEQKKSKESQELSKPMISYLGGSDATSTKPSTGSTGATK
jgi:EF hand